MREGQKINILIVLLQQVEGETEEKRAGVMPRHGQKAPSVEEFKISEVEKFQGQVQGVALRPNS